MAFEGRSAEMAHAGKLAIRQYCGPAQVSHIGVTIVAALPPARVHDKVRGHQHVYCLI